MVLELWMIHHRFLPTTHQIVLLICCWVHYLLLCFSTQLPDGFVQRKPNYCIECKWQRIVKTVISFICFLMNDPGEQILSWCSWDYSKPHYSLAYFLTVSAPQFLFNVVSHILSLTFADCSRWPVGKQLTSALLYAILSLTNCPLFLIHFNRITYSNFLPIIVVLLLFSFCPYHKLFGSLALRILEYLIPTEIN